ncbi:hypothetical protein WDU94_010915 [Cyamophila willieti]
MIEGCWVELELGPHCTTLIGNHYLPCNIDTDLIERYSRFLIQHIDISSFKVICLGDYNLPEFNWSLGVSDNDNSYIRKKSNIIYSLFCDLNLLQINFERINPDDNILDLVVSNFSDELAVFRENGLVAWDHSHPGLLISFSLPVLNHCPVPYVKKCFSKGDYLGLFLYLVHYNFSNSTDPDILAYDLNNAVSNAIQNFIPDEVIKPSKYPHWFSYRLRNLLHLKEKFHKKSKKCPYNVHFRESFQKFRRLSKKQYSFDERKYKRKVECDLRNNPKFFWQFVKSQYKNPHEISLVQNGRVVSEERIPNVFAEQFSSVFNSNSNTTLIQGQDSSLSTNVHSLDPPIISVADVLKAAKALKSSHVAGSDNFPAFILKGCINALAPVLCNLFNLCLSSGKFPTLWKSSIVIPVPKNNNISNANSYRPISLLPNFSKLFEKILVNHVSFHIKSLISPHQHGFLKGRSTNTNLLSFVDYAASSVLNQRQLDTVYFDLSKAFDVVPHDLLLKKLENFGLSASYVNFFQSYLSGRFFKVKTGNFFSTELSIPSGVPQGSNLGPILFIMFIDDIKKVISSRFELYADDLKISRVINGVEDARYLQNDIESILSWCSVNGMMCNAEKTVVLSFSRRQNTYFHNYSMSGTAISRKFVHRDLGVIMD